MHRIRNVNRSRHTHRLINITSGVSLVCGWVLLRCRFVARVDDAKRSNRCAISEIKGWGL